MNFMDAVVTAKSKEYLIGEKINGAIVDEIIVAPIDKSLHEDSRMLYLKLLDPYKLAAQYMQEDVGVFVMLDKDKLIKQKLFLAWMPVEEAEAILNSDE